MLDAPPEAEPDPLAEPDLLASLALDELEDEPGVAVEPVGAGVLDAPPEGDVAEPLEGEVAEEEELEPEGGGVVALPLELLLVLPPGAAGRPASSPHAARPRAMATATANVDNFMCPPWLE